MPRIRSTSSAPDDNSIMLEDRDQSFTDILDWLSSIFGFQVASNLESLFQLFYFMHCIICSIGSVLLWSGCQWM